MRFFYNIVLWIPLYLIMESSIITAQSFSEPFKIEKDSITPEIKYFKYIYNEAPWSINVAEVNLSTGGISVSAVKSNELASGGREKLSSMAERKGENVVAGINGDFFQPSGEVVSNHIFDGMIVKGIKSRKSQIAFSSSNEPFIDIFEFLGFINKNNTDTLPIHAVNFQIGTDSIVIYNKFWNAPFKNSSDLMTLSLKALDSIVINRAFRVVINNSFEYAKSSNELILAASGKYAKIFKNLIAESDTLMMSFAFNHSPETIKELVGGLPQILDDSIIVVDSRLSIEGASEKFSVTRHPRTAIGYNKDKSKLYLVTVDGRQKSSAGMTLKELSEFMLYIGCYDALNLDGGGSTTMIIKDKIVNSPSDLFGERKIGNGLLILTN